VAEIRRFEVSLPPVDEQLRIVGVLAALDDKIDSNRRLVGLLEQTAATLFRARFVDFVGIEEFDQTEIGRIPRGWCVQSISALCDVRCGYTASAVDRPIGPKFLRVKDINKQPWIDWTTVPYCEIDEKRASRFRLMPGDLVVAGWLIQARRQ
jgi:type I restriction enzyme S subunit